ncbi:hypothetical protein [Algoriphagus winogradskyi]|uniref:Glycosyltransferase RgtA/B/C/D-like domain-containing protein n=1 Tax=Algoriphagus winogradskyi TaxID=237017 RepID=A0ABY1NW78_9BACT|nr:hypothetical protein [Algoriphagus winogradskyi]SMP19976.1 hypothetical protein SAMN06265367_10353 [Algoriphagus winogradskyi]
MSKTLATFTLLSLLLILLGINRGFDFSDEGLYAFLADPNQPNIGGVFSYDLFFKLFYHLTGLEFGIIGLRIIRLISYFMGAFALAVFWKNLYYQQGPSLRVFLVCLAALFGGYGFLPPTLSYNSISVVLVCFWLAIVSKKEFKPMDWFLLGLIFTTLFYSKVTVCILLCLPTILYFLMRKSLGVASILLVLLPFSLFEGLFFLFFEENGLSRLFGEFGFINQRQDYTLILLIKYTAVGGFWVLITGLPFFIASKFKKSKTFLAYTLTLIALVILACVFYFTFITSEWSHIFLLITIAGVSREIGNLRKGELLQKELLFICVLILLPFVLHFGSNVYWMRLGIHYWAFWLLAYLLAMKRKSQEYQKRTYAFASLISFVLVAFGIWLTPFEGVYLWEATEKWEYKSGKHIWLAPTQVELLRLLNSEIEELSPNEVISLYSNPGLLYLLGKNSLYSPGYWKPSQAKLFLKSGSEVDLILFNALYDFPFDPLEWEKKNEFIQPNGEKLVLLWRK